MPNRYANAPLARLALALAVVALCSSAEAAGVTSPPVTPTGATASVATPTVVINIEKAGPEALAQLKRSEGVLWFAEFGSELLLGVPADALAPWLAKAGVRAGPSALARDEIVVRDLVCTQHYPEPVIAVVGGYSLVRRPAALAKVAGLSGMGGLPVPADGVIARMVANRSEPTAKRQPSPAEAALVARVSPDRWFDTMSAISQFNRSSYSAELSSAHDWISTRFAEAGLSTSSHSFSLSNTSCQPAPPTVQLANPIGIKHGRSAPGQWIVVGAHYDSRNSARCDGQAQPQPGANDNASGCAGVIELARVFNGIDTEKSIVFACFAGEEQGLVGAYAYVQSLRDSGQLANVEHMINLDMIGHATSDALLARIETTSTFQAEFARYRSAAATFAPELSLIEANTQAYSDHWPFIAAGVPAMFTWENGANIYPHYHLSTDLPQNMLRARALAGGILKMDAAVLAELAVLAEPALFVDGFEPAQP
jgi:hypothetical protein